MHPHAISIFQEKCWMNKLSEQIAKPELRGLTFKTLYNPAPTYVAQILMYTSEHLAGGLLTPPPLLLLSTSSQTSLTLRNISRYFLFSLTGFIILFLLLF